MQVSKENLKTKEVARLLEISPNGVGLLAREYKLKAVKEGKYWVFKLRDVENYMRWMTE
jgi:hypothetical protein